MATALTFASELLLRRIAAFYGFSIDSLRNIHYNSRGSQVIESAVDRVDDSSSPSAMHSPARIDLSIL
jgi:hypothetical protein